MPAPAQADLKQYDTKYYTLYTDLDPDDEKEAAIRMSKMAEEYHQRTKSFSGVIRTKFPFYLYKNSADYYAAGGMPGTAGVFIPEGSGGKLMAIAGRRLGADTWHYVQHEGFHQFAHAVIGGELPVWLNEGLAEYFGESIFTGDGFVTGIVPPWRLERLKSEVKAGQIKSLPAMMQITGQQWNQEMDIRNYDQAWSMVHFLVHGDDEKYQPALCQCITDASIGKSFDRAWKEAFGPADGFEPRWKTWWLNQPESPTRILYARAAVATTTSYIARAYAAKQTFANFEDFKTAVDNDKLKISPDDWLPRSLIVNEIRIHGSLPNWEIMPGPDRQPSVSLTLYDGIRVTGSFTLIAGKVDQVIVDEDDLAKVLTDAQALFDAGRKQPARDMVIAALKQNPKSRAAADARKFLQSTR